MYPIRAKRRDTAPAPAPQSRSRYSIFSQLPEERDQLAFVDRVNVQVSLVPPGDHALLIAIPAADAVGVGISAFHRRFLHEVGFTPRNI